MLLVKCQKKIPTQEVDARIQPVDLHAPDTLESLQVKVHSSTLSQVKNYAF